MHTRSAVFHFGDLEIDLEDRQLRRNGTHIRLSRTEWAILAQLLHNHGQVVAHRTLLHSVWGDSYGEEHSYLHTYMWRLRQKLEPDPSDLQYLLTEPGIGYRFSVKNGAEYPLQNMNSTQCSSQCSSTPSQTIFVDDTLLQPNQEQALERIQTLLHALQTEVGALREFVGGGVVRRKVVEAGVRSRRLGVGLQKAKPLLLSLSLACVDYL
jgi:DNA-binding winged helix-turn-helix (wHTH) protein